MSRLGLLLVALFGVVAAQQCPNGFTTMNGSCFLVSDTHATYTSAQQLCQGFNARLPLVKSAAVQQAITQLATNADPEYLWYIGLRRLTGNSFEWVDGSPLNTGDYTSWQPGQPNTGLGLNCVATFPRNPTGWRVVPCTDTLPYMCQADPVGSGSMTTTTTPMVGPTTASGSADPNVCPGSTYTGSRGTITSPGFIAGLEYGNNLNCDYLITVTAGMFALLTINTFDTEPTYDPLTIYDGSTTSSPIIARLSGVVAAGRQFEASSNVIYCKFTTDGSVTRPGFSIQYSETATTLPPVTSPATPNCQPVNYGGTTGTILSPNFPSNYGDNMNCEYRITVTDTNLVVMLSFTTFITEQGYDTLTLYDGFEATATIIARLSGNNVVGRSFYSSGNTMRAVFTSDSSVNMMGFNGTYSQSVPPTTPPPPTKYPPTSPSPQCGVDFFWDGQTNCYWYNDALLNFTRANAACQAVGAQLVSIHSQAQEDFVAGYINNATQGLDRFYTWIGLQAIQGQFSAWSDGTPVDYTSWELGQPNLASGNCAALQSWQQQDKPNGWRSLDCNSMRPLVCRKNSMAG